MVKLGFVVNPVAGIGGKVGLKGSDGEEILKKAIALGATCESGKKALATMQMLKEIEGELDIYTYPREMGADICKEAGLKATVIGNVDAGNTVPEDTIQAAKALVDAGIEIMLFAGGDGTARDILDAVKTEIVVLGIPTGCKIHSGVYALNPKAAGMLVTKYVQGRVKEMHLAEVMDIDEKLFRQGIVQAQLYGYLRVPNETQFVQNMKSGRGTSESATIEMLSNYVADTMETDVLYIVGTGSTTAAIMEKLKLPNTLLGVDLVYNKQVIASDCTERDILCELKRFQNIKIIVTVIGGQGYIFGRGNQQISAQVIKKVGKENIIIVAAKNKIMSLFGSPLHVDTGNEEVNQLLQGYYKIIVGYEDSIMMTVY